MQEEHGEVVTGLCLSHKRGHGSLQGVYLLLGRAAGVQDGTDAAFSELLVMDVFRLVEAVRIKEQRVVIIRIR